MQTTIIEIKNERDLRAFFALDLDGSVLLSGPEAGAGRVSGLSLPLLDELKCQADLSETPLIIEADGSRKLPLKAPADHEPLIPGWANQVVVVAGLSGLGQPLSDAWVHRPQRFSEISGLPVGSAITRQALQSVLAHPMGSLKNIPAQARRVLLLNQAVDAEKQAAGKGLADHLSSEYPSIIIANLAPPLGDGEIYAVHEKTAGIVLAAGASSRLGAAKQLLEWRGQSLVHRVASIALAAGLDPVIVVTGCRAQQVSRAVEDLPVIIVENQSWETGQSSSIIQGIHALPEAIGSAIFLLADQPLVPVELVRSLAALHSETLAAVVAPIVDGQRANPVLFDRRTFAELSGLTGDTGGRALFSKYSPTWLNWQDELTSFDVDTLDDYQRLLAM